MLGKYVKIHEDQIHAIFQVVYIKEISWNYNSRYSEWHGMAGHVCVGVIKKHRSGDWCTDSFCEYDGEIDHSCTGSVEYLKEYIQKEYIEYISSLAN